MQTTLEVRWFIKGTPAAVVQHWFKSECPGQLLTPQGQTREDLYAYGNLKDYLNKFKEFAPNLARDQINLKLREGNLELKLRQKQFGIETFTHENDRSIWSGRVEQWCKLSQQQSKDAASSFNLTDINWISVFKKRLQKSDRDVKSELTLLETNNSAWWSIAFEMPQSDNNVKVNFFREVVEQAAKTYSGSKLLAANSCGYADWLDKFIISQIDLIN